MVKQNAKVPATGRAEAVANGVHILNELPFAIQPTISLPDKVAEVLREMILSGKWAPGERVVETHVAKQLKVGQPTVREALGKLEEAGMVRRYPNSGCVVTELSAQEVEQMFTVRTELECLAAALAAENKSSHKRALLKAALVRLQQAALKGSAEEYYRADFSFHRTIWQLAENPFLEKTLIQLVIPLFNFAIRELNKHRLMDFKQDATAHKILVKAVLSGNPDQARTTVKSVLGNFRNKSLTFVQERN